MSTSTPLSTTGALADSLVTAVRTCVEIGYVKQLMNHFFEKSSKPLTVLNHDVLLHIMSASERNAVSRLMRTCHDLYAAGIVYLLRGPMTFVSRKRLLSFCRFMLRDAPSRFQHLIHLELFTGTSFSDPDAGNLLADLFVHASHLKILRLGSGAYLDLNERIPETLCSLTSLQDLTIFSLKEDQHYVLEELESSLKSVELTFFDDNTATPIDPAPLLAAHKDSLEEVKVCWVEFLTEGIELPRVHTLVMADSPYPELAFIMPTVPNVKKVQIHTMDDLIPQDELEEHRQLNITEATRQWTRLEDLQGDIKSLYMLAARCPVDHLSLHSAPLLDAHAHMLTSVVADSHPADIGVALQVPGFNLSTLGERLAPAKETLAALLVRLDMRGARYSDPSAGIVSASSCTRHAAAANDSRS